MAKRVNKTRDIRGEDYEVNYAQIFAIQSKNEKAILKICPTMPRKSGIYLFYRVNEKGENCAYVGQAKNLLHRCGQHLSGRETHIDKSLYTHKLYNPENLQGWKVCVIELCPITELDAKEQKYIDHYKNRDDVVLYNVTGGGQFNKRADIGERVQPNLKRYKSGKQYGYEKAREQVKTYFTKYLDYSVKLPSTKIKERKLAEFEEFLQVDNKPVEGN